MVIDFKCKQSMLVARPSLTCLVCIHAVLCGSAYYYHRTATCAYR